MKKFGKKGRIITSVAVVALVCAFALPTVFSQHRYLEEQNLPDVSVNNIKVENVIQQSDAAENFVTEVEGYDNTSRPVYVDSSESAVKSNESSNNNNQPNCVVNDDSPIYVDTAEKLLAVTEPGKTVVLTADIELSETWKVPHGWAFYSSSEAITTLDLNSYKLSLAENLSSNMPVISVNHSILYSDTTELNITDTSGNSEFGQIFGGTAGGIRVDGGVLRVDHCKIWYNTNVSAGGGIVVTNGGTCELGIDCQVVYNTAKLGGGVACISGSIVKMLKPESANSPIINYNTAHNDKNEGCFGGVYVNEGMFSMYSGQISNNTADFLGGAIGNAIPSSSYLPSPGEIDIYEGTLENNSAIYGGAIYNKSILNIEAIVTDDVSSVNINTNSATYGGAICNDIVGIGTLSTIFNAHIKDNTADYGAAIYNFESLKTTLLKVGFMLNDCTVANNKANKYGGAILNTSWMGITGGIITGNSAKDFGAGIVSGQFGLQDSPIPSAYDFAELYYGSESIASLSVQLPVVYDNNLDNATPSDLVTSSQCPIIIPNNAIQSVTDKTYFNIYNKDGKETCGRLTSGYTGYQNVSRSLDDVFVYNHRTGTKGFACWGDEYHAHPGASDPKEMKEIWVDHEHQWKYTFDKSDDGTEASVSAICDSNVEPICLHHDDDTALKTLIKGKDLPYTTTEREGSYVAYDQITETMPSEQGLDSTVSYSGISGTVYGPTTTAPTLMGNYKATYTFNYSNTNQNLSQNLEVNFVVKQNTATVHFYGPDKVYDGTSKLESGSTYTTAFEFDEDIPLDYKTFSISSGVSMVGYSMADVNPYNHISMNISSPVIDVTKWPSGMDKTKFLSCFDFKFDSESSSGTITPLDINNENVKIDPAPGTTFDFKYDGNFHAPQYVVTFKTASGSVITVPKNTCYTDIGNIPYVSAGNYTWTITGLNNFKGSRAFNWSIVS